MPPVHLGTIQGGSDGVLSLKEPTVWSGKGNIQTLVTQGGPGQVLGWGCRQSGAHESQKWL